MAEIGLAFTPEGALAAGTELLLGMAVGAGAMINGASDKEADVFEIGGGVGNDYVRGVAQANEATTGFERAAKGLKILGGMFGGLSLLRDEKKAIELYNACREGRSE